MRIFNSFTYVVWSAVLVGILALGCACPQSSSTTPQGASQGEPVPPETKEEPATPETKEGPATPEAKDEAAETGEGNEANHPAADNLPGRGQPCNEEGVCADGLTCVEYYGIAGPSGPKFTSCETPCAGQGASCPEGLSCITVADGPGQVCRAR